MSGTDPKTVVKNYFEKINAGELDALGPCLTPDFVNHDPLPSEQGSRMGVQQALKKMKEAFPDFRIEILQMLAEGDRVAVQLRASGTQQGEFLGQAPTNQPVTWDGIVIFRVAGDQLAERWAKVAPTGAAQPAGATQPPGEPTITMMPNSKSEKPVS